jgi:hypothetical protein
VKVMLDGQGADELLGGYHGFFDPYLAGLLASGKIAAAIREMALRRIHRYGAANLAKRLCRHPRPGIARPVRPGARHPGMGRPKSGFREGRTCSPFRGSPIRLFATLVRLHELLHTSRRPCSITRTVTRGPLGGEQGAVLGLPPGGVRLFPSRRPEDPQRRDEGRFSGRDAGDPSRGGSGKDGQDGIRDPGGGVAEGGTRQRMGRAAGEGSPRRIPCSESTAKTRGDEGRPGSVRFRAVALDHAEWGHAPAGGGR